MGFSVEVLTEKTIFECVNFMEETKQYDSVFTAFKEYTWFWFQNKPVNYDPCNLPRSQDAKPVIKETTSLYGIKKEALLRYQCRIGQNPYMLFVDEYEAADIDTELEIEILGERHPARIISESPCDPENIKLKA